MGMGSGSAIWEKDMGWKMGLVPPNPFRTLLKGTTMVKDGEHSRGLPTTTLKNSSQIFQDKKQLSRSYLFNPTYFVNIIRLVSSPSSSG